MKQNLGDPLPPRVLKYFEGFLVTTKIIEVDKNLEEPSRPLGDNFLGFYPPEKQQMLRKLIEDF